MLYNFENRQNWKKLGRLIAPDKNIAWMNSYTNAAFAIPDESAQSIAVYIAGRDEKNRSQIGKITVFLNEKGEMKKMSISEKPVFSYGEPGAFDENGVSYPNLIEDNNRLYLYYVGWMPTIITPFNLQIGLAVQDKGEGVFKRYSRAPVLHRTNEEYLSFGSCFVMKDEGIWKMWYTCFTKWGQKPTEHKHYYHIRYARSKDGIRWQRNNQVCIDFKDESEYAICRPSVWKDNSGNYHQWYAYRGNQYQIGYAFSKDGINWERRDELAGISPAGKSWESLSISYPHVFPFNKNLYMLYCGNDYGREGIGLAKLVL